MIIICLYTRSRSALPLCFQRTCSLARARKGRKNIHKCLTNNIIHEKLVFIRGYLCSASGRQKPFVFSSQRFRKLLFLHICEAFLWKIREKGLKSIISRKIQAISRKKIRFFWHLRFFSCIFAIASMWMLCVFYWQYYLNYWPYFWPF